MTETAETATPVDLDAARELIANCTKAPWLLDLQNFIYEDDKTGRTIACIVQNDSMPRESWEERANAKFIQAARTLLPQALDEIERLRKLVDFHVRAMRLNADPKGKWFKS